MSKKHQDNSSVRLENGEIILSQENTMLDARQIRKRDQQMFSNYLGQFCNSNSQALIHNDHGAF
jgi:hypothetical protein